MQNDLNISDQIILKDSIFRIGKVFSVEGRIVKIKVDKQKNASHLLYKGELIKNVGVGGYIKIIKGYISIIGKVESEQVQEEKIINHKYNKEEDKINRILNVSLLGFIDSDNFERGIKELPLIDNECFLLDKSEIEQLHDFVDEKKDVKLRIGVLALESGQPIHIGVNGLFASHIGIFGNTGSGKSYTLAKLYRTLYTNFQEQKKFKENAKFLLFDFNGEYNLSDSIISDKNVINLNTKTKEGEQKLVFNEKDLLNIELFSIIANATEKTQQPFLKRALGFYHTISKAVSPSVYFQNTIRKKIERILCMTDKNKAYLLLDYLRELLPVNINENGVEDGLTDDFSWQSNLSKFYLNPYQDQKYFEQNLEFVKETKLYKHVDNYEFPEDLISKVIDFLYLQLIHDVLSNRAQNEHIAPVINKLKSFQRDFKKVIEISPEKTTDFWNGKNFTVINLNDANLSTKKLIPLLVSFKLYSEHKNQKKGTLDKYLNIIIDEAHNILSHESQRESESWKDYRLETFEEIIKEGRKFGVFLTIASQRPSDISPTIISQLHNYFLHRLINNRDIQAVEKTISYLDKVSFESLPILPTGVCILAGLMAHIPIIVKIDEIERKYEPNNKTIDLVSNWTDKKNQF
jgi:uncharacterized protein